MKCALPLHSASMKLLQSMRCLRLNNLIRAPARRCSLGRKPDRMTRKKPPPNGPAIPAPNEPNRFQITLRRYSVGVIPVILRNIIVKAPGEQKPTASPTSVTSIVLVANKTLARSIRR